MLELALELLHAPHGVAEPVVLQRDARVVGERLEELDVIGGEAVDHAGWIADHHRAHAVALAGQHGEHPAAELALL